MESNAVWPRHKVEWLKGPLRVDSHTLKRASSQICQLSTAPRSAGERWKQSSARSTKLEEGWRANSRLAFLTELNGEKNNHKVEPPLKLPLQRILGQEG